MLNEPTGNSSEVIETSVEDDVRAAMAELADAPGDDDISDDPASEPAPKHEGRDEKGRFAPKEKEAAPAANTESVAKPDTAPEKTADSPPQGWTASGKEKWATLPPEIKQEILKRENDIHTALTRHDGDLRIGREMKEVISPYMPIIQAEGGNPAAAVKDLLDTAYKLRTAKPEQKAAIVKEIINHYGVDMKLAGEQQEDDGYTDPTIAALQSELQQLKQAADPTNIRKILQEEQEIATARSEAQAFAANPSNVHFEKVKPVMAQLLGNGLAKDYQEAYDKACWADPEIRSTLLQSQQSEQEAKRSRVIEAKRKAGSSITGSPAAPVASNTSTPNDNNSVEEDVRAAIMLHASSV